MLSRGKKISLELCWLSEVLLSQPSLWPVPFDVPERTPHVCPPVWSLIYHLKLPPSVLHLQYNCSTTAGQWSLESGQPRCHRDHNLRHIYFQSNLATSLLRTGLARSEIYRQEKGVYIFVVGSGIPFLSRNTFPSGGWTPKYIISQAWGFLQPFGMGYMYSNREETLVFVSNCCSTSC